MRYSSIPRPKIPYDEKQFLTIDDVIEKSAPTPPLSFSTRVDKANNPIVGLLDNVERPSDIQMLDNETEILSLLMKATGQSQHVVPSFYEGGDDVYIEAKKVTDVTVTDADRRAIHTISNYYNTLGIYRDDFDKNNNDKLARNAYYAICEKAMMDYMRSVQYSIKDARNGDTIREATEFFEAPNPQDTMGDIMAMTIRDVTRYDAGVIVKSFKKTGYISEIKPYLATEFWREQDRVPFIVNVPIMNTVDLTGGAYASHQQPTYQGWWSHGYTERFWQRSRTGVYIPFQPEEIAYFMMYPRTDGIYGTDFIKFLKYQIQYLIDSTKAAGKTFENGVVPSIVWEHPEVRTIPQLKQRIAELKFNSQGWQRFGSVIHTVNGEKVTSVAQSLHDMQWLEGQKFVAQLVWATWGFSPEEFMGGGDNRATAYVKRNITKSRLLYPLMTFLEGRINRDILPFMKGYRKYWKFQFVRDIELDDEQKVATTNSIKASTFLQYYGAGFPIEASMELSGLDKNQYKFDINLLEAEIMQNQMAMLGQQPGEQGVAEGGLENQEMGRYGPASELYVGNENSDMGQGTAQSKNSPREPSIDEEQYKKAAPEGLTADQRRRRASFVKEGYSHEQWKQFAEKREALRKERFGKASHPETEEKLPRAKRKEKTPWERYRDGETDAVPVQEYEKAEDGFSHAEDERRYAARSNKEVAEHGQQDVDTAMRGAIETIKDVVTSVAGGAKKARTPTDVEKSVTMYPHTLAASVIGPYVKQKWKEKVKGEQEEEEAAKKKKARDAQIARGEAMHQADAERQVSEGHRKPPRSGKPGERQTDITRQTKQGGWKKALELSQNDTRDDGDYDPKELAMGITVEMEHTNDPEIAKEIAKDHLDEFDDYYSHLKKMENAMREGHQIEYYTDTQGVRKAKVYINHPSEAPKGRPVRRGNKGGYYYITSEQHHAGKQEGQAGKQAKKKKKGGGKGWGDMPAEPAPEGGMEEPAPAPDIEGAEMQVKISGSGVGIVAGIVAGRLVASKLDTPQTMQFIKIVQKKASENADAEDIIMVMVQTAEEMGLDVTE